ncbi:glycosyltransferase [Olivibacter sitiensis]|uniref:glycosyltransferase n=1 Tax=Olivibacter sitiensis TaxID=376470 RepID=UPI00041ACA75|nr:glycosyltransferase [Olivibacter sitiensis]
MPEKRNIIFSPDSNPENKYIETLVGGLRERGYQVSALDDLFSSWAHFRSIDLVHLNWFENLHKDRMYKSLFRKFFVLIVLKLFGKKIVWTMHNRESHEKDTGKWSNWLTNLLCRWSDAIVIHSHLSLQILAIKNKKLAEKVIYVPHPNFVDAYGSSLEQERIHEGPLRLLFLGAVKPYKNIEMLLSVCARIGKDVELKICGNPSAKDYANELKKRAANSLNITFDFRFIPDMEIPDLMAEADLLVFPYDLASSLNSGSVYLAFSYQRSVICPSIGSIMDLSEEAKSKVLTYSYKNDAIHKQQLETNIRQAIQLKKESPLYLEEMGLFLYAEMLEKHDPYISIQLLDELYQKLLKSDKKK